MGDVVEFGRQTGPRTEAGKRRSSLNALRSGAFSRQMVIPGIESREEFETLVRDVLAVDSGADPVVALCAERLVSIAWRLRRLRRWETSALSLRAAGHEKAQAVLHDARDLLERMRVQREALSGFDTWSGLISVECVQRIDDAICYLFETADFKSQGITHAVNFESEAWFRVLEGGRLSVRAATARKALETARRGLPEGLAGSGPLAFVSSLCGAMDVRISEQLQNVERLEQSALESLKESLELRWEDAQKMSDAERRLESSFSRALRDLQDARRLASAVPKGSALSA